jgi:hypothetical protein
LAVYDRNLSTYEQSPGVYSLVKKGAYYQTTGTIKVSTDKVVLSLQATDRMTGVPNPNGIFLTELYNGNSLLGGFTIDEVGYDETRYLNAHIDYRTKLAGGAYLQYIFPLDGDKLDIYKNKPDEKCISLKDTAVHAFRLVAGANPVKSKPGQFMLSGQINIYETDNIQVVIPETGLYDSIYFTHFIRVNRESTGFSPIHDIHTYLVPVHSPFNVRIKADKIIPYPLRKKMLIRKIAKDETDVHKANWELGWYSASFREFGSFQLISDDVPPQIVIQGVIDGANLSKASRMIVTATDNNESIRKFRAELDGKWLMFSQKGRTFTYKFDDHCLPGNHTLKLSVEDEAGNTTVKTIHFTR